MASNGTKALAILAVAGMAGAAWGQVDQPLWGFAMTGPGRSIVDTIEIEHTISVTNGSVSKASLSGGGVVSVTSNPDGPKIGVKNAFLCEGWGPCPGTSDTDSFSSSGMTTTPGTSVGGSAWATSMDTCVPTPLDEFGDPAIDRARAGASATAGLTLTGEGVGGMSQEMGRASMDACWVEDPPDICCLVGKTSMDEYGFAVVGAHHGYEISRDPMEVVTITVSFEVEYGTTSKSGSYGPGVSFEGCPPMPSCPGTAGGDDVIISLKITGSATTTLGTTSDTHDGALVMHDDGTFTKLGVLDDPAFDPLMTPATLNLSSMFMGEIDDIDIDYDTDTFLLEDLLSGDVDNDGQVCGDDRAAFMDAYNSSIGDANYNIRADFDLDGDVDGDDFDHLNTIGCTADLDCDGSLTIFDQNAFGNAFSAMDPVADWDGDGMFTTFDFLGFSNTFDLGCP